MKKSILRRSISLVLVVLLLAPVAGCKKSPQDLPAQTIGKSGDITDPVELEKLWQEYFYDSIATIGNTREFNSAQEIEPLNVARFCGLKYVAEHGEENLKPIAQGSSFRLLPLNIVLEYTKRYFDLTSLDVSKIEQDSYDQQKHAFIFDFGSGGACTSYNTSRGDHLDKVTRNNDGTVTAVLVRPDPFKSDRIELTMTYTLKQREDGSLNFVNGRWDYINNHLVSLIGDYQRFDQITGFTGNMEELSMLGEVDDRLILAYTPYKKEKNGSLMLINPKTMTVEKELEVSENFASTDVSLSGECIKIRLKDRVITVSNTFAQEDSVSLPKTITDKINREPQYNDKGAPDVFFGGYDVSGDRKRYVYADEIGVKLFNTIDNSEKLLSKTFQITGSELLDNSYHKDPRFVADEQKVITTMTGYEGAEGYTLCDLESGKAKTHGITAECSSTGLIRYDTGLLEVNTHLYNQEKQIGECKTIYLDFKTGDVKETILTEPGDTGYIRMPDYGYVGQNYAAFITSQRDANDNANNMSYLNRLNLKTLQIEPKIISVQAAEVHILGVLTDGGIVVWYCLNPSENGVCITK